uniref:RWD domain-containing protein n=1 Tax=Steinernema glaseri TaxID=37863 RepID=A0A1I8AV82_9BILA
MGEHEQTQMEELEALEAIYPNELEILNRTYPNISVVVNLDSHIDGEECEEGEEFEIELKVDLTANYPDEVPNISLGGMEERLSESRIQKLTEELRRVAEENLGMPLVFTVISHLQEQIGHIVNESANEKEEALRAAERREEEEAQKKFEGTRVTVESFLVWKAKFDAELAALKADEVKAREAALAGRLTGRQLFLRDTTLNISDIALIEQSGANDVEVNESLFEDEELDALDLSDSDED